MDKGKKTVVDWRQELSREALETAGWRVAVVKGARKRRYRVDEEAE